MSDADTPTPLFSYTVPRLATLPIDMLVTAAPSCAMNVFAAREVFKGALYVLCQDAQHPCGFIDPIPANPDLSASRRLDIVAVKDEILVRLCDDTMRRDVIYQTALTPEAWSAGKEMLLKATESLTKSFALERAPVAT